MTQLDKKIKKVCSFYISDWHLVTMLLPNIDKKINKGITITTITETNLEEKIQTLLDKLRIKNKERILKIDWKAKEINEEIIKNIIKNNDEIIVNGNIEYIEQINQQIEKILENNSEEFKNKELSIINCYDITKYESKVKEIIEKHDKILNTAGEKDKQEYINSMVIANKYNTALKKIKKQKLCFLFAFISYIMVKKNYSNFLKYKTPTGVLFLFY